jgi:hypothetical protein
MAVRFRSVTNRVDAPHFEALDRLLDVAEPAVHALAAEHGLRDARIDRWRWDQPEIVLFWIDRARQNVSKSIRFFVDEEGTFFLCSWRLTLGGMSATEADGQCADGGTSRSSPGERVPPRRRAQTAGVSMRRWRRRTTPSRNGMRGV